MSELTVNFTTPAQYSVVLWQEPDEPEWWYARHPEYDAQIAMFGSGHTQDEALQMLRQMRENVDTYFAEEGERIPQPGEHLTKTGI